MHNVLIIDDEPDVADALYNLLYYDETLELDVFRVYTAYDALALLERMRIDIVLSDIKMPGMDGLQLLEAVRARWPHCRVLFITGHPEFDYIYRAMQLDAVSYLLKTESRECILDAVHKAAAQVPRRETEDAGSLPPSRSHQAAAAAREYIEANLHRDISLTELAEQVYLNPSYFSRVFRQETGMTPVSYITARRVERAGELLRHTRLKINAIAKRLGFVSTSYFVQVFRRVTGQSPGEYRATGQNT